MVPFRVQFNDYDTYQSAPLGLDHLKLQVLVVPIIRIYGSFSVSDVSYATSPETPPSTEASSAAYLESALAFTAVVHIHNYFPYLFLDAPTHSVPLTAIEAYLESVLADSFRRQPAAESDGEEAAENNHFTGQGDNENDYKSTNSNTRRKFIARVTLCKATPVYGYHVGTKRMLKVSLLSPLYKSRLTRLVHDKKIKYDKFCTAPEKYKPNIYESHLPMLLQFLADYNLYGCGWVDLDACWFRSPVLDFNSPALHFYLDSVGSQLKTHLGRFLHPKNVLSPREFPRIATSLVEIDTTTAHILNRNSLRQRKLHHDFVERYVFNPSLTETPTYLTSTLHIVKDLKYQCEIRGKQPVATQNIGNNLGFSSTEWANSPGLRKSLDYVVTLTGKHETDYKSYAERTMKDHTSDLPTAFESVDTERKVHSSPELLRWSKLDSVISQKLDLVVTEEPLSQSGMADKSSEALPSTFDSLSDALTLKEPRSDESVPESEPEINDNFDDFDSIEVPHIEQNKENTETSATMLAEPGPSQVIDDQEMFNMTQRHSLKRPLQPPLSPVLQVNSSFTEADFEQAPQVAIPGSTGTCYEMLQPVTLSGDRFLANFESEGILQVAYEDPFYSKVSDGGAKPLVFANKKITVPIVNDSTIPLFDLGGVSPSSQLKSLLNSLVFEPTTWEYAVQPPSADEISLWLLTERDTRGRFTQIEPPQTGSAKFKYSYRLEQSSRRPDSFIRLTNFHAEVHINTSSDMAPDPETGHVSAIFYHFDDANLMFENTPVTGVLLNEHACKTDLLKLSLESVNIEVFADERAMVDRLVFLVRAFDPDILCGYEINALSWGYLVERFRSAYDINLLPCFSRGTVKSNGKFGDRWGYTHTSAIKINGRHLLNVWRTMRSSVNLTSYALENVVYHLLHQTMAKFSNQNLSSWLQSTNASQVIFVLTYYMQRIMAVQKIIDGREIITQSVEQARFIGVDFYSVFFRGSQYKVESILCRISKVENLLLNSPSKAQVSNMKPLEAIPLILEPDSNLYKSPLVVLDFQSLYPSIMIAYNYCFSTILGRLDGFDPKKNTIGYLKHVSLPPGLVHLLASNDDINLSPNGYMFAKSSVRKSLLSKMLEEILNTRIQVKGVMLMFKDDKGLSKLLNSRQLALKLIANVTYGYASASFSGRMPNSAIADAIVSTGREILTTSIAMIELSGYGAKVVYGDTDSLFMYLPGKSRADAFKIGRQLAALITAHFPDPIQLKFEKVYHPCVLLSKKRYVGNCFEYESQTEGTFQAKGIETVRRDGIPAQLKMVEKTLRILFSTNDLSLVKKYTLDQFRKIMANRISVRDFCFAKEVRFGTYKNMQHIPAGAAVAMKKVARDPRSEPQYKERVPYVVIEDVEKPRIRDRSVAPEEFLAAYKLMQPVRLDYDYYITRVLIPPLERIFNLVGADIRGWYRELPRQVVADVNTGVLRAPNIQSKTCIGCGGHIDNEQSLCLQCLSREHSLVASTALASRHRDSNLGRLGSICYNCVGAAYIRGAAIHGMEADCVNQACDVYFERIKSTVFKSHLDQRRARIQAAVEW